MISENGNTIGLNSNQIIRESFDRFDDNLVKNILSYLTFNEKVLFESVSKQWKKCVYNRQKQLSLTRKETEDNRSLNKILEPIEVIDYNTASAAANGLKQINKFSLNSLLKKCKSIVAIVLDCYLAFDDLDIIFRNCPNLKIIEFNNTGLSADDLDYLGSKYGERLEKLQINSSYVSAKYWNKFLIYCKNLKELVSQNFCERIVLKDEQYLPKLERTNYVIHPKQDGKLGYYQKYDQFCEKFSHTLTKLNVNVFDDMNTKEIAAFFTSTCKLKNLVDLECFFPYLQEDKHGVNKYISQLSKRVLGLKRLRLSIYSSNLKVDQFFYAFEGFKNLVDFDVYICGYNKNKSFNGSVECLKSSVNLKYLTLSVNTITEEFFEDIDKYLPNLSELTIECESEITDKTISKLSHLQKLKKFYLYKCRTNNRNITDESVCAVINGCPALETLCFGSRPNITNKTIENLIHCANIYPKRSLHFECDLSQEEVITQIPAININSFVDKIPSNLTIDYTLITNE